MWVCGVEPGGGGGSDLCVHTLGVQGEWYVAEYFVVVDRGGAVVIWCGQGLLQVNGGNDWVMISEDACGGVYVINMSGFDCVEEG